MPCFQHRYDLIDNPSCKACMSATTAALKGSAPLWGVPRNETGAWLNPDNVALLKKLWGDGMSGSQIAARIGCGLTRSAVIGKVHRLGLAGRVTTSRMKSHRRRKPRKMPRRTAQTSSTSPFARFLAMHPQHLAPPPVMPVIPEHEQKSLLALEDNDCRFPVTEDRPFRFCARPKLPGMSYCAEHCGVAYQAPQPARPHPAPDYSVGHRFVPERERETA